MLDDVIDMISHVSPTIAAALGGPAGVIVANLLTKKLGQSISNTEKLAEDLKKPEVIDKLKQVELEIADLQDAREEAAKDTGLSKLVRPMLAIFAMIAIFADIFVINYVKNDLVREVMIVMLIYLVWDVRQIYKFYFGFNKASSINLLSNKNNNKKH